MSDVDELIPDMYERIDKSGIVSLQRKNCWALGQRSVDNYPLRT